MKTGKVFLMGAGPGDPGLITCKGLAYLEKADVVVYDYLADERLLENVPASAERIYVGKTASHHTMPQHEINDLLVAKAKESKTVVRLKGGDPFVLGRGGEEAEALVENNIPYEVVPGITSAVAVPAYAGIPVTHRGLASSFAVITGHEDPAKEDPSINWENLATGVDTLVFLMGMQNIDSICIKLTKHGRDSHTPVAVIKDGTKISQITVLGTLGDIAGKVREQQLGPPAIIVVGEVSGLAEKLRWIEKRPLFGKRVLVTRARQQASKLSRLLEERGAEPIELPAIEIESALDNTELQQAVRNLGHYQWIIFTSVNGFEVFFQVLRRNNLDARSLSGINIWVIGPATADCLRENGIIPDYVPKVYTTEGIIEELKQCDITGKRFLLPRADIVDDRLSNAIREFGGEPVEIIAYRTHPARESMEKARQQLLSGQIDVITFTSSSTVTNIIDVMKEDLPIAAWPKVASIGPKTTETAVKAGIEVDMTASEQTIPGLVTAIEDYFRKEMAW
ncbi:uroporphyrinogen-III C-methyltransferase [Chloroflexota bacterium]